MPDRVTTPFTAASTAADVVDGVDLTGRRAIVTGGASGLGIETARALATAGAEVTLAVRDLVAGARVAEDLVAATGNKQVFVGHLELADPASVAAFVAEWDGPLHILVNNAGVMAAPLSRTPDGWESQFATNHLGHFALATGLHPALAAAQGARVVAVASSGHIFSGVVFDDINFERRAYEPWSAYGQSKSANVLFAVEAARRWADDGITANALHPGGIRTNLQRHVSEADLEAARKAANSTIAWRTPEQGAATSVLLAASPLVAGVTGRYFEDCNEAAPNVPGTFTGVAPHAIDPEAASRLWELSSR
ncbi:NAD(P)-dependent dehydrogenase, short-chain alcohol dehydrogenase family [Asanoa hainanensis]|uniref:Probable oxidoreductase n=1 Tax=Asanoa hainanensis TaxID=560556 RepID=A0A239PAD1_9ACTN|nr:SDR family NAD(P)-dependent oxidoreductase [Asanoa hainanensis]SNT64106.1 NAD(P)-dependent dehydrogenase, short-chain alcohol dehydrogenase family [Asanoa hainanensis]